MSYLEEVQTATGAGSVGAQAYGYVTLHHARHLVRPYAVIANSTVTDRCLLSGKQIDFRKRKQNGMGAMQAMVKDSDLVHVRRGPQTELVLGKVELVRSFRQVGVNIGIEFLREMAHADTQFF